jgi:hypothetical protein
VPITYTNRKGITYWLCRGTTKTGRERFYFARQSRGEPVEELPPGFVISESVNGVVSLSRDRPSGIQPAEMALIERALARHPQGFMYRVEAKDSRITIYEACQPALDSVYRTLGVARSGQDPLIEQFPVRAWQPRFAPVMRFILADPDTRHFRAQRWCYLGSIDDWIDLYEHRGPLADLAKSLVPTLGTDQFFDLS